MTGPTAFDSSASPVLHASGLTKQFGGVTALHHVTLRLAPGERHALIGPNGAGKTTLINLLTGVLPSSAGRISLQGTDITHMPAHQRVARGLVRTFQVNQLFGTMSPLQTLALVVSQQRGLGGRWWRPLGHDTAVAQRCALLLEQCGLTDVMHQRTDHLAYGKRRMVEIAIALACEPRVLLLDEPAAGVPAAERPALLRTLAALPTDAAVLLIEHDMDLVFAFAQTITVLAAGAVLAAGPPQHVAHDARVQAAYLGPGHG